MDKKTIIRNFTKCALVYDRYADIQEATAFELLEQIKENNLKKILEIGCGTGNYTKLLRLRFQEAKLKAVDISANMIEVARQKLQDEKVEFIVADAEGDFSAEGVDLITSNACFQWFNDLEQAFLRYNNLLNKKGVISFSIFGPLTFQELNISLQQVLKGANLAADEFLTKENIEIILGKFFAQTNVTEIKHERVCACLKDLLKKIKYTGVQAGSLGPGNYFTPRLLKKLEKAYLDEFGKIKVTYQVFFFKAKKI